MGFSKNRQELFTVKSIRSLIWSMKQFLLFVFLLLIFSSCSRTTYYIVRHGEKEVQTATMTSDVPLSEAGKQRAQHLKDLLINKTIGTIFSTPYNRTRSTVQPLSDATGVPVQLYSPKDTVPLFIKRLKDIKKKNVLVCGHSNTVDDLVNQLMGQTLLQDLPDTEYDNLFIVTRKGNKWSFSRKKQ